jgi:hypothetical protein
MTLATPIIIAAFRLIERQSRVGEAVQVRVRALASGFRALLTVVVASSRLIRQDGDVSPRTRTPMATNDHSVWRGVSKEVEDGRRLPALQGVEGLDMAGPGERDDSLCVPNSEDA